ncbi:hypothetical protein SLS62_002127 [Diatrype stigma]|uniref:Uncharacterized protein n=1 Tax=Diatrype stigma TaxID=117547 RepID=A0AAN9YSP1_9PEZI
MVSLSAVLTSNSLIRSSLPPGLVAVFIGATSGIGEISVKTFAKYARKPRVYIVGRSQDAADRILAECASLNPEGQFSFTQADVSLIRGVDELCGKIKAKENSLNLLFLSAGVRSLDRKQTTEGLHLIAALNYYSRVRVISNLLPLLQKATSLRRIVTVGGGGYEGAIDTTDFQALRVPLPELRSHLITLITLGLEAVARTAPEVSIVHDYPGTVKTPLLKDLSEEMLRDTVFVPLEECGERHVYLATSAKYPPGSGGSVGVPLGDGLEVASGSTGEPGNGIYSVGQDGEGTSLAVQELLADLRGKGVVDAVRHHTEAEFKRITGE